MKRFILISGKIFYDIELVKNNGLLLFVKVVLSNVSKTQNNLESYLIQGYFYY